MQSFIFLVLLFLFCHQMQVSTAHLSFSPRTVTLEAGRLNFAIFVCNICFIETGNNFCWLNYFILLSKIKFSNTQSQNTFFWSAVTGWYKVITFMYLSQYFQFMNCWHLLFLSQVEKVTHRPVRTLLGVTSKLRIRFLDAELISKCPFIQSMMLFTDMFQPL